MWRVITLAYLYAVGRQDPNHDAITRYHGANARREGLTACRFVGDDSLDRFESRKLVLSQTETFNEEHETDIEASLNLCQP